MELAWQEGSLMFAHILMGIGLAAVCGLRAFLPLFVFGARGAGRQGKNCEQWHSQKGQDVHGGASGRSASEVPHYSCPRAPLHCREENAARTSLSVQTGQPGKGAACTRWAHTSECDGPWVLP